MRVDAMDLAENGAGNRHGQKRLNRTDAADSGASGSLVGLQVARALAALSVTFHHALETSNGVPGAFSPDWLTTGGAGGVDIFFVISGFIMAHTSLVPGRPAPSPAAFLQRRATRIYPLYWLACLAMLSLMALGFFQSRTLSAGDIVAGLALLPGGQPIIGVAWTLVYEVYFYLVFAVCLMAGSRRATLLGTGGIIVSVLLLAHGLPESEIRRFLTDPIPLEFLLGLGLAQFHSGLIAGLRATRLGALLVLCGFALLYVAPLFVAHETTHGLSGWGRVATWGTAGAVIVAGLLGVRESGGRGWIGRVVQALVALGNASYALYLSHFFVLMAYGLALRSPEVARIPQYLLVLPVVVLACFVGGVTHLMVERPLLRFCRRLTGSTEGKRAMPFSRRSESNPLARAPWR